MLQRYHGGDSDENACSGPGNGKDGHVQQNFHIFYNEAGYENLAEVMKNAADTPMRLNLPHFWKTSMLPKLRAAPDTL